MSYAIGFLAGVICTFGGLLLFSRWADAVSAEEHRRKVEHNRRTYEVVEFPTSEREDAAREEDRKAA